jgi:hypothetical protein
LSLGIFERGSGPGFRLRDVRPNLNEQNIIMRLERRLAEIERYLAAFCIGFIVEQEAKTFLLKEGLEDLNHGARQITRVVRNYLEFPFTDLMLSRRLLPGTTVTVGYQPAATFLDFLIMVPSLAYGRPTNFGSLVRTV